MFAGLDEVWRGEVGLLVFGQELEEFLVRGVCRDSDGNSCLGGKLVEDFLRKVFRPAGNCEFFFGRAAVK